MWRRALLGLLAYAGAWGQGGVEVLPPTPVAADVKPVLVLQTGHNEVVAALGFSPDGRLLASAGRDGLRVWDVATGRLQHMRDAAQVGYCNAAVFLQGGRTLATAGVGGVTLHAVASLASGAPGRYSRLWDHLAGPRPCWCRRAAFTADGATVATADSLGFIRVWDVNSGRLLGEPLLRDPGSAWVVAISHDGRYVASGSESHWVGVWDLATRQPLYPLRTDHSSAVRSLAFSPDDRLLASGSWDCTVRLWDVATGQPARPPLPNREGPVVALAFSPDGRTLVTGHDNGAVLFWDVHSGQPLGAPYRHDFGSVVAVAVSPDGQVVASCGTDSTVRLWPASGDRTPPRSLTGQAGAAFSVAWSPDGRKVAVGGLYGLRFWDALTGRPALSPPASAYGPVRSVAFSPRGDAVAASHGDRSVRIWDVERSELRFPRLAGLACAPTSLAFSPDGRLIAAGNSGLRQHWIDHELFAGLPGGRPAKVRDLQSGRTWDLPIDGPSLAGDTLAFAPDGRSLAIGGCDKDNHPMIRVCHLPTGQVTGAAFVGHTQEVTCLAYSPDGGLLASASRDGTVRLWDPTSGQPRGAALSGHHAAVLCLAFAPDGRTLATGSVDKTVQLWDVASGQPQGQPLVDHLGLDWAWQPVYSLGFAPDRAFLVSAHNDGAVRVWDLQRRRMAAALYSLDGDGGYVAVTPEGYFDCSADSIGLVRWRIGDTLYPFDLFAAKFQRPDLIHRALAGEDIANAPPLDSSQIPPNLGFKQPAYGTEVTGGTIPVLLQAAGRHPIARVELTANGKPLPASLSRGLDVPAADQTTRSFALTLPLPPGEPRVRLQAVAYDTASLRSRVAEVTVFRRGVKQSVGALHVLSIGINRYPKLPPQYQLRFAVPDAQAIADVFAKQGGGKPYTEVKAKVLLDDQASESNLKFALRDLKDTANENDVAVVYISGHGVNGQDGAFYFPTHEVDLNNLPGTALSWQDFAAALREVRAKRVIVLADTCHSGGIVGDQALNSDLLATRLNRDAHQMVFTAAARDEVSIAREEWGHGAFSKALVQGLVGLADADKDGNITFAELRDYVTKRVQELTADRQHPQLPFLDNFEPEAVLARAAYGQ